MSPSGTDSARLRPFIRSLWRRTHARDRVYAYLSSVLGHAQAICRTYAGVAPRPARLAGPE
jgi:hypothetical protein